MALYDAAIDTTRKRVLYRDFILEPVFCEGQHEWDWCHQDYRRNGIGGFATSIFDAIEQIDAWYLQKEAA